MTFDPDSPASQQALADLLGVSRQAISLIEGKGTCSRDMPMSAWVRAYVAHLREVAAGRLPADGDIDLVTERALLARRQRERIELDMAVRSGELVAAQDVLTTWAGHIGVAKQALLALPAKAAGLIAPAGKQPQAEATLRKLIKETLLDLSESSGLPRNTPGATAPQQQGD